MQQKKVFMKKTMTRMYTKRRRERDLHVKLASTSPST